MDELMLARLFLMTQRPLLLAELIEAAASKCDICESIPRNRKLIQCVFCDKEFCLSCLGKENTRICCKCNFVIATGVDKNILKQFSVAQLRLLTNNYNVNLGTINEKDQMIDAILASFKKSIKNNEQVVNVNELKQKMIDMEIKDKLDKERQLEEEKLQSKKFSDYSNICSENKRLSVNFCNDDSIDISLDDIPKLTIKEIKVLLDRFKVDYQNIIEKKDLISLAINLHQEFIKFKEKSGPRANIIPVKGQLECSICMDASINCVFINCRHSMCCYNCGIKMHSCPICRKDIKECIEIWIG